MIDCEFDSVIPVIQIKYLCILHYYYTMFVGVSVTYDIFNYTLLLLLYLL